MDILGPNAAWIAGLGVFTGAAVATGLVWYKWFSGVMQRSSDPNIRKMEKRLNAMQIKVDFLSRENRNIIELLQEARANGGNGGT